MLAIADKICEEALSSETFARYWRHLAASRRRIEEARRGSRADYQGIVPSPPDSDDRTMKKPQPPQDLWGKMDALVGSAYENDEGFTTAEYMQRYKISRTYADNELRRLVAEGKLVQGKRRATYGYVRVYRPA